jgi:mutator protein MutT
LTIRAINTKFTVTVAGIIFNDKSEVLLIKHLFRPGKGWGLPGGFLEASEQPDEALRRELREEIGLELDQLKTFTTRSFRKARQLEVVFLGHSRDEPLPQSIEVERCGWFPTESLPDGVPRDQKSLIKQATAGWSKTFD